MLQDRSFSPSKEFGTACQPVKARLEAFLYRYNRFDKIEIVLRENKFEGDQRPLLQLFAKDIPDHRNCNGAQAIRMLENLGVLGADFKPKRLTEFGVRSSGNKIIATYAAEITDPDMFRIENILDVLYRSSEEERIRILPLEFLLDERALPLMRYPEQLDNLETAEGYKSLLKVRDAAEPSP